MILFGYLFILLICFYLLARVCDEYFIESLDKIAKKLKMSSDVAGATLMAIGSSAPELFVAMIALIIPGDHGAIGAGTIVGSALFNVLFIIGVVAVVRNTVLSWQPVIRDTIFYSLSISILIFVFWDGRIVFWEAAIFVILYIAYIIAVINWRKILPYKSIDPIPQVEERLEEVEKSKWKIITRPIDFLLDKIFPSMKYYIWVFLISIIVIALLSWVLVESAVGVAHILNISESIIALTILAIGTSIPDLVSSVIVAKQGRGDMAISNAIGSNVFDVLVGLGVPWLIVLIFSNNLISVSTENLMSSIILLFATVLVIFFLLLIRKWKIGKYGGFFLIGLYVLYLIWSIIKFI